MTETRARSDAMRKAMEEACTVLEPFLDLRPDCIGKVRVTQELLDNAKGNNETERRRDLLAEARIGCCQKCGCLSAVSEFLTEQEDGKSVEYVTARCANEPSDSSLGRRIVR